MFDCAHAYVLEEKCVNRSESEDSGLMLSSPFFGGAFWYMRGTILIVIFLRITTHVLMPVK